MTVPYGYQHSVEFIAPTGEHLTVQHKSVETAILVLNSLDTHSEVTENALTQIGNNPQNKRISKFRFFNFIFNKSKQLPSAVKE